MGIIRLNNGQIALLSKFPSLNYDLGKNVISGILSFDLEFQDIGVSIIDEYQIEIDLNRVSEYGIPVVREIAGRIVQIAKNKNVSPADLHLNNFDGEICIIIPPKAIEKYPNGFDLQILLEHLQEHFYWVSYYEKFNKPPWKESGHGELGYLELYIEDQQKYGSVVKEYFCSKSRPEFRRKIRELRKKYKI